VGANTFGCVIDALRLTLANYYESCYLHRIADGFLSDFAAKAVIRYRTRDHQLSNAP
jgi:hypothetical protein